MHKRASLVVVLSALLSFPALAGEPQSQRSIGYGVVRAHPKQPLSALAPSLTEPMASTPVIAQPYRVPEPAPVTTNDPLLAPRPDLGFPLVPEPDPRSHRTQKLSSSLQSRTASSGSDGGPDEEVPIIVSLFAPVAAGGPAFATLDDRTRQRHVAALAHDFTAAATPLGFHAEHALSLFPILTGRAPASALERIAESPWVLAITPDAEIHATRVEGSALMRAGELRSSFGANGAGVGVAVLDTGIDWNHPELKGRVASQVDFTGTTGSGMDDGGHGTSVAGIIAGSGGMAPAAHLHAYKILDKNGSGTVSNELRALEQVFANRNANGGIRVVNLSVGGSVHYSDFCDDDFVAAAQIAFELWDAGITTFAASGNEAAKHGISFPACLAGTLSVGAVYDADLGFTLFGNCYDVTTAADEIACYSNSAEILDLLAPSHCATTPAMGGGMASCFGGTSAATPYAAGVAAQILTLKPGAHLPDLTQAFWLTGRYIVDSENAESTPRINAYSAYYHLLGTQSAPPAAPSNLTVTSLGSGNVRLSWNDNSNNESEFLVQVSTNAGAYRTYASVFWDGRDIDLNFPSGSTYTAYVVARNSAGLSAASNVVSVANVPKSCKPSATTACLLNNRFIATVRYRGGFDDNAADTVAQKKSVTGFASSTYETAFFYFNKAENIEMMLKMLDQGNTNASGQPTIAVLFGSATPLRVELTIMDTRTGAVKTYVSPFLSQTGQTDFTAFVK